MASTGNVFAGTGENNAGIGATAWTNPGNVVSDNTTDATCAAAASSQYLVARNFNFSAIPDGATIQGILVRVEASEHSGGTEPLLARLQNETATLFGTGKSNTNGGNISGTAKAVYTYGSTSDVWGATLTPAIVKDADFGVRFWFTTAHDIRIDYVTMAVTYSVVNTLTAETGTFTLTEIATPILAQRLLTAAQATFNLTGIDALLIAGHAPLVADVGSFVLTGIDASLLAKRLLLANTASFDVGSPDVGLLANRLLTAEQSSFILTGIDAILQKQIVLLVETGVFNLTGIDTSILAKRLLTAESGSFIQIGNDANLLVQRLLTAGVGEFNLTGIDVILDYSGGAQGYTLTAETGNFNLAGNNVGLLVTRKLLTELGTFNLTGIDINFVRWLVANTGVFVYTGNNANLKKQWVLKCETGHYYPAAGFADLVFIPIQLINPLDDEASIGFQGFGF